MSKIGRNDPCPCGSGKKYKKCCSSRHATDEKLQARIIRGYEHMMRGETYAACDCWWEVWLALRSRLRPEMTTTDEAQAIYPDSSNSHIHDWAQDFTLELGNAARHRKSYAKHGVELCQRMLDQFPDEPLELFHPNVRADLAEFLLLDDRAADGDREFAALIRDCPDQAASYVRYATALECRGERTRNADDLRRAMELLQQAIDYPVADAGQYDLEEQLAYMRTELDNINSPGASATEPATGTADS